MSKGRPRKNRPDLLLKSAELIGWALGGLEREIVETRSRLASLTAQADALRKKVRGRAAAAVAVAGAAAAEAAARPRKRNLTPEARKRISDRMTKRWAQWRKEHKKSAK
jgi:septal ring factor EnvC (AmiA/AmiB activator)